MKDWEGKVDRLFFSAEWVGTHKRVCALSVHVERDCDLLANPSTNCPST